MKIPNKLLLASKNSIEESYDNFAVEYLRSYSNEQIALEELLVKLETNEKDRLLELEKINSLINKKF